MFSNSHSIPLFFIGLIGFILLVCWEGCVGLPPHHPSLSVECPCVPGLRAHVHRITQTLVTILSIAALVRCLLYTHGFCTLYNLHICLLNFNLVGFCFTNYFNATMIGLCAVLGSILVWVLVRPVLSDCPARPIRRYPALSSTDPAYTTLHYTRLRYTTLGCT